MQLNSGTTILVDQLYSDAGVFRGRDVVVNDGMAFRGYIDTAGSGNNPTSGYIYNPVGSGRNVFIDYVATRMNSAAVMQMVINQTGLNTTGAAWASLKAGAADGVALIAKQGTYAIDGDVLFYDPSAPITVQSIPLAMPIMLPPGKHLMLCNPVSTALWIYFEGREVAIT